MWKVNDVFKLDVVVHIYNLSPWKIKPGGSKVDHP